jgi:NAD/NADP transhydrogenase beta subunit
VDDAYFVLEAAQSVVFIPGYGMAVAQAQHAVKELADLLENNGTEVRFAIHPVAGRMPGHMNVLLAEADVPYEQLNEMDQVNRSCHVDVAIVIGANDVVNPAALDDPGSPIYGMPIINAHEAARFTASSAARAPVSPASKTRSSSAKTPACSTATPRPRSPRSSPSSGNDRRRRCCG